MSRTMHAAVLEQVGKPLAIRKLTLPPLSEGQVLVKILFSGACRSQVMETRGGRGEDPWLPHLLGHEGVGIVEEIGAGVTKVKPGDEVILTWIKGSGLDAPGAKYDDNGETINSGSVTTFSNYSIVAENRLVIKPESLARDAAILFGCALPTGAGMVINELDITPEDTVAVLGLGGIGLSGVIALKSLGVKNIIAIDVSNEKLEKVHSWGVSHCINSNNTDVQQEVKRIANGGVQYCIEAGGRTDTIELGFSLITKNGGKLLFASHPPDGETIRIAPHELISGKQISGSWGGAVNPDRDVPIFHQLFSRANVSYSELITKRYSLEQINEALNDLEMGKVFRPLIVMEHEEESAMNPEEGVHNV